MWKANKGKLIFTSLLILLPLLVGLILWNQLPENIATHFGADGEADGWSSKAFTVFALPAFLLVVHWVCLLATMADPKHQNISGKLFGLLMWVCPLVSLLMCVSIYGHALGLAQNTSMFASIFVGLLFMVIGNYLPKCRQNYTVGIKLPWTMNSTENWNRTHRMAGPIWMAAGFILVVTAGIAPEWLMVAVLVSAALVPTVYSYVYYAKHEKSK